MAREKVDRESSGENARRRERKDTRPQEIVEAAFEEFAAKGFAGTRLEDVAARARVSKGLPYLYFKTKEELFKAVVRSVITSHFDVIREQVETTTLSVEDFLKGPFLSFIQELVCSKRVFIVRLLIAEGHKHPELTKFYFDNVVSRGMETLRGLIDRGVERGDVVGELPLEEAHAIGPAHFEHGAIREPEDRGRASRGDDGIARHDFVPAESGTRP